jgi:Phosphotransferase enzyme family
VSHSAELPFVAAPPGTLDSVTLSAEQAAQHWGFDSPQLLRLGMNAIFTAGGGVLLRVSHPTSDSQEAITLARVLTRRGLRVPTYLRDEAFVTSEHSVFAIEVVNDAGPVDWVAVGEMVAVLHRIDLDDIPTGYPLPFCGDFPWWNFVDLISEVGGDLDDRSRAALDAAIGRCLPVLADQRRRRLVVCHGDVHPGNVIQSAHGPVLLDWDLLCRGPAAWDHAPLMTWTQRWGGEPGIYEAFAEGYGREMRGDPVAQAIAELRLVAATLMRLRAARSSPAAAAEAELRLRYWRGEGDAPQWTAQ